LTCQQIKTYTMSLREDYLRDRVAKLEKENKLLNIIVKNGKAYVNFYMTDCDGIHSQSSATCKSLEELYQWLEDIEPEIEGPFSWEPSETPIESATYGQGWDIN
jgi:hypothetical protein